MSSKTPKVKTTTTTTSSTVTSATTQRSSASRKSATPVPQDSGTGTRFSRVHEKEELANLNDRLACYIDKVRNLETENSRLNREVRVSQETISREVTSVKSMYDNELSEARKLLDELANEKAKLEIDTRRIYEENIEYKTNLDKKNKECQLLITNLSMAESRLADVNSKLAQVQLERKKLADENKAIEKEKHKFAQLIGDFKTKVEEETLARVAAENKVQTLREEVAFKEQIHQQQINECRTKKQVEISEIDGRLTLEYEEKLYQSLQEIREQYEIDLENNKDEIKNMYEEKIRSLSNQLTRNTTSAQMAIDEMRQTQKRVDDLNKRLNELESEKTFLQQKTRDLERQLEGSNCQYVEEISKYNSEITRLREEMAGHAKQYQDLMDTKVALDLEIAAYRKLLEGEEERLNITPVTTPRSTPRNSGRRLKRKREYFESDETSSSDVRVTNNAKGDLEVSDACLDGSYVKIFNKGNKEIAIGGWQLVRKAGENTTIFKFHRSVKVEPGATVTVWSSDANQRHEPPENILMKGQKWVVANNMSTSIVNNEQEEVAIRILEKQQDSHKVSERRLGGYYTPSGPSSRLGGEARATEEKCSIM